MKKVFIILMACLCLAGCGKKEKPKDILETNTGTDVILKKEYIVEPNSKTRPFAVMINCHNDALPQAGLQDAYIVYELMVEGGITRMMALFKDIESTKIGSIRSARTQYLGYVLENDAVYVHAGGAADAISSLPRLGIDDVDVDGVYGVRDSSLNRAWEHTLFTTTSLLKKGMSDMGISSTSDKTNLLTYSLDSLDLSSYEGVKDVNEINIKYSDYRTSGYKYDADKKVYLRNMNGTANTDLVTKKQYEVKNIIVYGVKYENYCDHGYCAYQKISNIGTGEGYYISEGKAIAITWNKSSNESRTIYKVKSTGKELVVNNGNTYIQIYPNNFSLDIK